MGMMLGGVEVGLIFALRAGLDNGVYWPVVLMGVLSALLLALGVLRHYWDIYVHRTVRGISFIFVGIDAAGDVFSLISVCMYNISMGQLMESNCVQFSNQPLTSWV